MAEPREITMVIYVLLAWAVVNQMEASVRFASFKTVNVAGTTNYVGQQQQRIIVDQQQQHQHQQQIFVELQQQRLATADQQQDDGGEQQTVREPVAVIQDQQPIVESEALARQQQAESQLRLRRVRHESSAVRVLYQIGSSEEELPVCEKWAVCSKVDMYQWPWVERQCRCPSGMPPCSHILSPSDGHTITDKTRQFKLCEPIKMLPKCRYFRDMAWTLRSEGNGTLQTVHCHCPKGSVAYLLKRQTYLTESKQVGYQYSFACSPQSRLLCQRKEPCRLFTVRKRQEMVDEVNTNSLCMCPQEHSCPTHHTDSGVIQSKNYSEESIRTYSGYCMPSLVD